MRRRARSAPAAASGSASRWSTPAPRLMIALRFGNPASKPCGGMPDAGVGDIVADRRRASGQSAELAALGVGAQARRAIRRPAARRRPRRMALIAPRPRDLAQAVAVEREPLQGEHRRAVVQLGRLERFQRAVDRHAERPRVLLLVRRAGALRHLRRIDQRRGRRTCARPTSPADGIRSNIGTSVRGATPISSWHSRRAASATSSPRSTRPGRHLDQVAQPEREMRAEPELADQHDLVALQIDRQDDHDARRSRTRVALERRAVAASRDSAHSDRSRRRDFRGPIERRPRPRHRQRSAIRHRSSLIARPRASGEASRLKAAANSARV